MSDIHDSAAPRRPEDDFRRDEPSAPDDPFKRRRALDESNVPPQYREPERADGVTGERGITPCRGAQLCSNSSIKALAFRVGKRVSTSFR